jgi:hypothetical protein
MFLCIFVGPIFGTLRAMGFIEGNESGQPPIDLAKDCKAILGSVMDGHIGFDYRLRKLGKAISSKLQGLVNPAKVVIENAVRRRRRSSAGMLDKRTDLNTALLDRFRKELRFAKSAKLSDVEMSEELLDAIGFFV